MSSEPAEAEEPPVWQGPDPRDFPDHPDIWGLVLDIEANTRVQLALGGSNDTGRAYAEARQFLVTQGQQLRSHLAGAILNAYQIPVSAGEEETIFSGAGKPRAFGAEGQPPPATA